MTESEREKIVKEIFEAYNRRDIDFIINSFADDLIFVLPSGETIAKDGLLKPTQRFLMSLRMGSGVLHE